jgi:hypothetical protein
MTDWYRLDACERDLGPGLGGADEPREARAPRTFGSDERPGDRAQSAVEGELAERRVIGEAPAWQLLRRGDDRKGDREVEPRSLLAETGGGEIDGDPLP